MDVTLDALVGAAETPALVRTDSADDANPTGAFDALIAALSLVPAVAPPSPPVVWSGDFGLPGPVVTSDLVPLAPSVEDDEVAEEPVVVAQEAATITVIVPIVEGQGAAPIPVLPSPAPPSAVPPPPAPTLAGPTPPASTVPTPLVVPVQTPPQPEGPQAAPADIETSTFELAAPTPEGSVLRPLGKAAIPTQVSTSGPAVAHVPVAASPADAPAPAVGTGAHAAPEAAGAPLPARSTPTFATPVVPAPAQGMETPAPLLTSSIAPTTPVPQTRPTTEDGQPLESRLVEVMRWQAKEGGGRVEIKLRPEYLGAMTVTVHMEGGVVKASLAAESQSTRDFLQAEAGHLKTALEDHGFTLETFEVRDDREASEQQPRQRQHQPHGNRRPTRDLREADSGETFDVVV